MVMAGAMYVLSRCRTYIKVYGGRDICICRIIEGKKREAYPGNESDTRTIRQRCRRNMAAKSEQYRRAQNYPTTGGGSACARTWGGLEGSARIRCA